jgi:hypothetical protein
VNNSLSINWDQPEMIRLRGQLDPSATDDYDRDTLRFLLEKELGTPAPAAKPAAAAPARPGTPVANAPSSLDD